MTEDVTEVFAVVAEWKNQGPILMETEGPQSSYAKARERSDMIGRQSHILRTAIVRLEYVDGNELLIHDLKRMQE